MKIEKCMAVAAAAATAFLAGCSDGSAPHTPTEAEIFGYKGDDLAGETNMNFVVTAPATTNWVPERVLSVLEHYEFTGDELALLKAAGVMQPCAPVSEMPQGYVKDVDEPWFAYWTKPADSFGISGVAGVLVHYDGDKKLFETGESYFSSYWPTKEEAEAALAKIKTQIEALGPKKFHPLDAGWIAEYVRLCVTGVVGMKADGKWSCMIDFRDKCGAGCGVWEPVDMQQERRDRYDYAKALKAWKAEVDALLAKNRELVAKAVEERGLECFADAQDVGTTPDGRVVKAVYATGEAAADTGSLEAAAQTFWDARAALVESALGVKFDGEISKERDPDGKMTAWHASAKGDIFEAEVAMMMPVAPEEEPQSGVKPDAGEDGASVDEESRPEPPKAQWRVVYIERFQQGIELPPRPQQKSAK